MKVNNFNQSFPKHRTGKECKKTECSRHKDYLAWIPGNPALNFCMECKHAHVSQYKKVKGENDE